MAKVSKYIKVDKNILMEYIYDNNNLISENYKIFMDTTEGPGTGLDFFQSLYGIKIPVLLPASSCKT